MKYIKYLNDIGRLLSDVHHSESISRRELIALNLNKDLKDTLTDIPIGSLPDNTIKTAKDLKITLNKKLKIQKRRVENQSSTVKQGNFKRPSLTNTGTFQGGRVSQVPINKGRKPHVQRGTSHPLSKTFLWQQGDYQGDISQDSLDICIFSITASTLKQILYV
ncbi:hypothetical protein NQ317_016745 [Molorchus minor]|uniref:Uncharacterized protein n=1 Tax=Molorchus minor TaxID=1323400 RepID=A0ABQ9J1R0_9CUCU|nr:hypothetical protein NQ317_016745 [Molorchus minor]